MRSAISAFMHALFAASTLPIKSRAACATDRSVLLRCKALRSPTHACPQAHATSPQYTRRNQVTSAYFSAFGLR